jgi:protein arginine N-methyltransferase 2
MMDACAAGELATALSLLDAAATDDDDARNTNLKSTGDDDDDESKSNNLSQKQLLAAQQTPTTGQSPLMVAAQHGHIDICQMLLDAGAPWNAIDRYGKCAGDFATENEKWNVVNLLVEAGTKAEVRYISMFDSCVCVNV